MTAVPSLSTPPSTAELDGERPAVHAEWASLADIAREEQARIYGELVPEHHSNNRRLPACVTGWERARLRGAARELRGDK